MKDRVVEHPNRYQLVPVAGTTDTYDVVPVPGTVTEAGTAINKALLLSDLAAGAFGLEDEEATVNNALISPQRIGDIMHSMRDDYLTPDFVGCSGQVLDAALYPELSTCVTPNTLGETWVETAITGTTGNIFWLIDIV